MLNLAFGETKSQTLINFIYTDEEFNYNLSHNNNKIWEDLYMTTVNSSSALSSILNSYYDNTLSTLTTTSTNTTSATSTKSTTKATTDTESLQTKLIKQSGQLRLDAMNIMTGKTSYSNSTSTIEDFADISDEAQKLLLGISD